MTVAKRARPTRKQPGSLNESAPHLLRKVVVMDLFKVATLALVAFVEVVVLNELEKMLKQK